MEEKEKVESISKKRKASVDEQTPHAEKKRAVSCGESQGAFPVGVPVAVPVAVPVDYTAMWSVTPVNPSDGDIVRNFYCAICQNITWMPLAPSCGHAMCSKCADDYFEFKAEQSCPTCKGNRLTRSAYVEIPKMARQTLGNVKIFCPGFRHMGCTWRGEESDASTHIKKCLFALEECPTCALVFRKTDFHLHRKTCIAFGTCDDCGETVRLDKAIEHLRGPCGKRGLPCPNACQTDVVWAQDRMQTHRQQCPREPMSCTFPGCKKTVERSQMLLHLDDWQSHIECLFTVFAGQELPTPTFTATSQSKQPTVSPTTSLNSNGLLYEHNWQKLTQTMCQQLRQLFMQQHSAVVLRNRSQATAVFHCPSGHEMSSVWSGDFQALPLCRRCRRLIPCGTVLAHHYRCAECSTANELARTANLQRPQAPTDYAICSQCASRPTVLTDTQTQRIQAHTSTSTDLEGDDEEKISESLANDSEVRSMVVQAFESSLARLGQAMRTTESPGLETPPPPPAEVPLLAGATSSGSSGDGTIVYNSSGLLALLARLSNQNLT